MPYVVELADNPERDVKRSNESFDKDPRTKKAKEAYKKQQKLNSYRRKVKRLNLKLKGLEKGTEQYTKVKQKYNNAVDTTLELEDDISATDARLIDDIWKTV